jgi:hypothetical protein
MEMSHQENSHSGAHKLLLKFSLNSAFKARKNWILMTFAERHIRLISEFDMILKPLKTYLHFRMAVRWDRSEKIL